MSAALKLLSSFSLGSDNIFQGREIGITLASTSQSSTEHAGSEAARILRTVGMIELVQLGCGPASSGPYLTGQTASADETGDTYDLTTGFGIVAIEAAM